MNKRNLLEWLLIVPVVVIALLMVRAEYKAGQGQMYRVSVEGYDPRDLVHGHYLAIRYNLTPLGLTLDGMSSGNGDSVCFRREGATVRRKPSRM
jgi:uncharacterized membrane-anchored protein